MATLTSKVKEMLEYITDNVSTVDTTQRFRDMLDECYSFDSVGGPFAGMLPSRVLEEMDPIAFRCGVSDYSNDDTYEINGEEYDQNEVDEKRDEFIEQLEDELLDLEDEREDVVADDADESTEGIDERIDEYKQWIKECEGYVL